MTLDPIAGLALAVLLGWVLAEAGLGKWRRPLHYAAVIDAYRLLPAGQGRHVARPLALLEIALALALLVPATRGVAAGASAALLALYAAAIALNLWRGRSTIDCGCGGARAQPLSRALLARNAVLIALALWLALAAPALRGTGWLDTVVALAAAAVAILAYASANLLIANRQLLARAR
jgi:hypothetical protein